MDKTFLRKIAYNNDSSLASETLPNILNHSIEYTFDTLGRRTAMKLQSSTNEKSFALYSYDSASRLASVSNGSITANYARISGSSMLDTTTINNGSSDIMTVDRNYDNLNRLTSITSSVNSVPTVTKSFSYTYNDADKRIRTDLADGTYWLYHYDDLGQVTSGIKYNSSDNPITNRQFGYSFDTIGNRLTASTSESGSTETKTYTSNELNQYTNISRTGETSFAPSYDDDGNCTSAVDLGSNLRFVVFVI